MLKKLFLTFLLSSIAACAWSDTDFYSAVHPHPRASEPRTVDAEPPQGTLINPNQIDPGTFSGNGIVTGSLTGAQTGRAQTGTFTPATGLFTQNEFDINSASASTEWCAVQDCGSVGATSALAAAMAQPSGSSKIGVHGFAGFANTSRSNGQAVGGYFQARCLVNSTSCWGVNGVAIDVSGLTTGVTLTHEWDIQPQNRSSAYSFVGNQFNLFAPMAGSYGSALSVNASQVGAWGNGLLINIGALGSHGTAVLVNPSGRATSKSNFGPPNILRSFFSYWNGSAPASAEYDFVCSIGNGTNPSFDLCEFTHSGSIPTSNTIAVQSPVNFSLLGTNNAGETFTLSNFAPASGGTITVPATTTGTMAVSGASQTVSFGNTTIGSGAAITSSGAGGTMAAKLTGTVSGSTTPLAAKSCGDTVTATITGAAVGNAVIVTPPTTGLKSGLIIDTGHTTVTASNSVQVGYCNVTNDAITPFVATLNITVIQ